MDYSPAPSVFRQSTIRNQIIKLGEKLKCNRYRADFQALKDGRDDALLDGEREMGKKRKAHQIFVLLKHTIRSHILHPSEIQNYLFAHTV